MIRSYTETLNHTQYSISCNNNQRIDNKELRTDTLQATTPTYLFINEHIPLVYDVSRVNIYFPFIFLFGSEFLMNEGLYGF